jgi:hypothetical protein
MDLGLGDQQPGIVRLALQGVVQGTQRGRPVATARQARDGAPHRDLPAVGQDLAHLDDVLLAVGFAAGAAQQEGADAEIERAVEGRQLGHCQELVELIERGVARHGGGGCSTGAATELACRGIPIGATLDLSGSCSRGRHGDCKSRQETPDIALHFDNLAHRIAARIRRLPGSPGAPILPPRPHFRLQE